MENKLGILNDDYLKNIEYRIVNFKHKLIDESYTFGEETIFSIEYLQKLHIFLFGDLYDEQICLVRDKINKDKINNILSRIHEISQDIDMNREEFGRLIYELWYEQIFFDGNTRTIRAFLKVYCHGFNISVNHNFDEDIYDDFFIPRLVREISSKCDEYDLKKLENMIQ